MKGKALGVATDNYRDGFERTFSKEKPEAVEDFRECQECSKKLGTPVLCPSCLSNRGLISKLKAALKREV